jgi:hypothetical protein
MWSMWLQGQGGLGLRIPSWHGLQSAVTTALLTSSLINELSWNATCTPCGVPQGQGGTGLRIPL